MDIKLPKQMSVEAVAENREAKRMKDKIEMMSSV